MKSFTVLGALAASLCNKTGDSTVLTLLQQLINDGHREVCGFMEWQFLENTYTISTVASQQFYTYPAYTSKPMSVTVTVGNQLYTPEEATSRAMWDRLNRVTVITSDYPQFWYPFNGQIGIYPIPATSSNTITVVSKVTVKDLSIADYTTGGILTAVNGSTTLTGTGTTWATSMAGRWIRITASDTANKGDGQWYQIASVASTTSLTLNRAYNGTAITAGNAAYNIGEMPLVPENYQNMLVYWAVAEYWGQQGYDDRSTFYMNKFNDNMERLIKEYGSKTSGVVLDYGRRRRLVNPNLYVTLT